VHVDAGRDELVRRALDPHVAVLLLPGLLRHLLHELVHHRARDRGVVELLRLPAFSLEQFQRRIRDVVRLDVIRVTVDAILGIGHHHVGTLVADDHRKLADMHHAKGSLHRAKAELLEVQSGKKRGPGVY